MPRNVLRGRLRTDLPRDCSYQRHSWRVNAERARESRGIRIRAWVRGVALPRGRVFIHLGSTRDPCAEPRVIPLLGSSVHQIRIPLPEGFPRLELPLSPAPPEVVSCGALRESS